MEQPSVGKTITAPTSKKDVGAVSPAPFLSPFPLITVYIASFFFSLHTALTSYIDSSFLSTIFPGGITTPWGTIHEPIGIIFAAGSLFMLISLSYAPRILRRLGNHNTTLAFIVTEILLLAAMAHFKSAVFSAFIFAAHLATLPLIRFSLDVFLESATPDSSTGTIRGIFLTAGNFAWVLAPLTIGFFLTDSDYWKIYIAAAALMIPVWYLVAAKLHFFHDPQYEKSRFWRSAKALMSNKRIRHVFISDFLLWFFYAWMDIYMPLYLHTYVGFSWPEIGLIFSVMLLPFVIFQYPLGRLADKSLGEKELLIGGFLIMAVSSILVGASSTLTAPVIFAWMGALFFTRIGASTVEVMDETYFFKNIDGTNSHILSFHRNAGPLALLIAPLTASIIFEIRGGHTAIDFRFLFVFLGVVMLLGVWNALLMEDTN